MLTKAERTSQFIIETVAPIFNKKGYAATSMADLTRATGLTKGALYGNFANKEELALEAFNYNVRRLLKDVGEAVKSAETGYDKLKAMTNWYVNYYRLSADFGGCPVLNVSVDSQNNDEILANRARDVIRKLKRHVQEMIELGQKDGTLREELDAADWSGKIYSMIQGSIFVALTLKDPSHIHSMIQQVDHAIETEMKR